MPSLSNPPTAVTVGAARSLRLRRTRDPEFQVRALLRQRLPRSAASSLCGTALALALAQDWPVLLVLRSHRILTSRSISLLAFPAVPSLHTWASPGGTLGWPLQSVPSLSWVWGPPTADRGRYSDIYCSAFFCDTFR